MKTVTSIGRNILSLPNCTLASANITNVKPITARLNSGRSMNSGISELTR